jgi:hypothetical protein
VGVGFFFKNKLSRSLHHFRNFPGHSTGKQGTDDTRHARPARTRTRQSSRQAAKSSSTLSKWAGRSSKLPSLQNRIPHRRAERLFFFWARPMHQGGRNGATKPPFRARKGALTSVVSDERA